MNYDKFGQAHCSTDELCDLLYKNPQLELTNFFVDDPTQYNTSVRKLYANLSKLRQYKELNVASVEQFDQVQQSEWYMPDTYLQLDIAEWLLGKCTTEEELQRVGQELLLYQERNLFNLLRFMKYLVDTLKDNNIVWGVGRGSSVASYILYLIGVHRINSIYYDLDIAEFLK
jgi:DNA polymerase III alpha subunit